MPVGTKLSERHARSGFREAVVRIIVCVVEVTHSSEIVRQRFRTGSSASGLSVHQRSALENDDATARQERTVRAVSCSGQGSKWENLVTNLIGRICQFQTSIPIYIR